MLPVGEFGGLQDGPIHGGDSLPPVAENHFDCDLPILNSPNQPRN
jgi:hypothetical protein